MNSASSSATPGAGNGAWTGTSRCPTPTSCSSRSRGTSGRSAGSRAGNAAKKRPRPRPPLCSAVEAGDRGAVLDEGAVVGGRIEAVGEGAALGLARAGGFANFGLATLALDPDLLRRAAAAALDREVADAVAGVDDVFAAVGVEAVFAGLTEHRVRAAVADQDIPVEGALHVLVGRREVNGIATLFRADPGFVLGE